MTSTGRRLLILREISVMQDDDGSYYDITAYVYIGCHAFTLDEIWSGVDAAERAGVSLGEMARALTHNALRLFHEGQDCIKEVTMAKLVTQRAVLEIADQSLQIHGGYGYMKEYGIERAVRDARLGPIGGGTDEVMKEILGKLMGL